MNWNHEFGDETLVYAPRRTPLQKRFKQLLLVLLFLAGLYFFAVHPWGQSMVTTGKAVVEATWHFGEEQFDRFFGPELILRQRAKRMYKTLQDELPRLQQIEEGAGEKITLLQEQLPSLLQRQVAVEQELLALLDQQHEAAVPQAMINQSMDGLVHRTQTVEQFNANTLSTQIITYGALQKQIAGYQQALRLNRAAFVQTQALEGEVQRQLIGIETTLRLFETLMADYSTTSAQRLSDEELWALRSALSLQVTQAQTLRSDRHAIEETLSASQLSPIPTQEIQTASP